MKSVPLGETGIQVSALCFGAMLFGTKTAEETAFRLLDGYVDAGGSFIDTANVYACWVPGAKGGESEAVLGRWIKSRGNRSKLFIATKLGSRLQPSGRGLRPEQIREECDKSLARMGIDHIDLYYSHFHDPVTPPEVSMEAFEKLRKSGKVRLIGASNHPTWRLAESNTLAKLRGWATYCCIQQRHSYLAPKPGTTFGVQVLATPDLHEYCQERKVTMIAYSPLLGGVYGRDDKPMPDAYNTPGNAEHMAKLRAMAAEKHCTPNQLVLAWMLHRKPVVLPLFSASTESQLKENLASLEITLSDEEMANLT